MSNTIKQPLTESDRWVWSLDHDLTEILVFHGLERPEAVLRLRVYDLLNLYKIDAGRAETIVMSLYTLLNENDVVDIAMYFKEIRQPYNYKRWKMDHRRYDAVTVKDLVMADGINRMAVKHLFGIVCRAFYHSDEYDPRLYRYAGVFEILSASKKEEQIHE